MQRVIPSIGKMFHPMEENLREEFFLALFKGAIHHIPGRAVTGMSVKQDMIDLPYHNQTSRANWMASCVITGHLVAAIRRTAEFLSGYHALFMGEGRDEIFQWQPGNAEK